VNSVNRHGHFQYCQQHIRFAIKLACAVVLALFVGFHFQRETPRWAALTAAIVAAGPAFARAVNPTPGGSAIAGCCVLSAPLLAVSPRW
jgi:p-hydroxybenzoic acid efflux pump subunit AaeB